MSNDTLCNCHCHNEKEGIRCKCIKNCIHCHPENFVVSTDTTEEYQSGDATRSQILKEAGISLEEYRKSCLSVEEYLELIRKREQTVKAQVIADFASHWIGTNNMNAKQINKLKLIPDKYKAKKENTDE
jgi:hypothetical protein